MIKLENQLLTNATQTKLASYQTGIDSKPTFEEKVEEAKRIFPTANKIGNRAFDEVKVVLTSMCCGSQRCSYCEDSKADEVEHISPKDWYPEKCFQWENYCYACGPCNGPKNNNFAVFLPQSNAFETLKKAKPIAPPPVGDPVLISPRVDNPMDYLFLEMAANTFFFIPIDEDKLSRAYQRASYTTEILRLNSRSYLVKARRSAFGNYRARLREYLSQKNSGVPQNDLDILISNLKEEHHQTVWQEMKRQHGHIAELKALFHEAPEALLW